MRNKVIACITQTSDSNIKFEENRRKIIFLNQSRSSYLKVQVDGCTLTSGSRCDNLLLSEDEQEERYVELKGIDVMHAIDQLEVTINKLGECDRNRHSYVICTNVAPTFTTAIQKKKMLFKSKYKSELVIREKQHIVAL